MAFKVYLGFKKKLISFQIINLVVFICVMSSGVYWRETTTAEWTDFVAMTAFWVTGILLIFYLLHVIEKFHVIPWMTIEMGFTILWAFFYLTCSIDLAINASKYENSPPAFAGKFDLFEGGQETSKFVPSQWQTKSHNSRASEILSFSCVPTQ